MRRTPALEALEGRALLSVAHPNGSHPPHPRMQAHPRATVAVQPVAPRVPPNAHPGPVLNQVGTGHALKSPRLYPYTTSTRAELNGAAATAFVNPRGQLILTGVVAGTIDDAPATADDSAYYVWGIDRGWFPGPGPFPRRPNVRFDALVVVSITPAGVSGAFQDLARGVSVPILPSQVAVGSGPIQDFLKVGLPASLVIPPGTTQRTAPTVNFFPTTTFPPARARDVVSFTPEFRSFPIALTPIV